MSDDDPQAEPATPTERVIAAFGGIRPMAAKLEVTASTVQGWKTREHIPAQRRNDIVKAAKAHGIALDEADLDAAVADPNGDGEGEADGRAARPARGADVITGTGGGQTGTGGSTRGGSLALILAGLALLVALASPWWGGWLAGDDRQALPQDLADRLSAVESAVEAPDPALEELRGAVADLSAALDGLAADDRVAELASRLDGLEEAVASGVAGDVAAVSQRLTGVSQALEDQAAAIASLRDRVEALGDDLDAAEDDVADAARQDAVDRALADTRARLAEVEALASQRSGTAAAMALAASQVRQALDRGLPFADSYQALDAVAPSGAQEIQSALNRLAPHAEAGVATLEALGDRLAAAAPAIRAAGEPPPDGWLDSAWGAVSGLVTVRRAPGEHPGSDVDSTVARAEGRLAQGNLAGAIDAVASLTGAPAEAASDWLAAARARQEAVSALASLDAAVVRRLSQDDAPTPAAQTVPDGTASDRSSPSDSPANSSGDD
jgi:hypothetical protein